MTRPFLLCVNTGRTLDCQKLKDAVEITMKALTDAGSRERRPEFAGLVPDYANFPEDGPFNLVVGTPDVFDSFVRQSKNPVNVLVILPDAVWDSRLTELYRSPRVNLAGVLQGQRLIRKEPEEMLRLEECLKETLRDHVRNDQPETAMSKAIDWKVRLSRNTEDPGFVSFFADPATRDLARNLKHSVRSLLGQIDKESFETIRNQTIDEQGMASAPIPSILLLGESGTGKSLLSGWIAEAVLEDRDLLAPINISAMPQNLVDTELFGNIRGAYTDATQDRPGLLLANKGKAVFLDEIGDMLPEHQSRLLLFMDQGTVRPVGSHEPPVAAPCLLIAATNRPVRKWANTEDPRFRADLLYRFDHIIHIPPLRERKADLRLLISLTLQDAAINPELESGTFTINRISLDALEYMEQLPFPGNFRELRNILRKGITRASREGTEVLCLRHIVHETADSIR